MKTEIKYFFYNSELLDYMVLRPLSHINGDWELFWDIEKEEYQRDPETYAYLLNNLIEEISNAIPSDDYHSYEDKLIEYAKSKLNWDIQKDGKRWNVKDYRAPLEQGAFFDFEQNSLVNAAAGRIRAAIKRRQFEYDDMEESHRFILSAVMCIIIFQRIDLTK